MLPAPKIIRDSLSSNIQRLVKGYPSLVRMPIAWGEMDMFGHLNNVWHIRYAESARMAYINQILKPLMTAEEYSHIEKGTGLGIILKSNFVNYKFATTFPDNLILATKFGRYQKDRFSQLTLMVSEKHERVAAQCETVIVSFDHSNERKVELPTYYLESYRDLVEKYGSQDDY